MVGTRFQDGLLTYKKLSQILLDRDLVHLIRSGVKVYPKVYKTEPNTV